MIVSLTAGDGHARRQEPRLRQLLSGIADPVFSYPESLAALREAVVAEAESGATHIGIAGGDGTLHHAVNALDGRAVSLVPLPLGSGNDFSRALGLGSGPARATEGLTKLSARRIDVIDVNGHRVCTVAGAGIVADTGLQIGRLLAPGSSARAIVGVWDERHTSWAVPGGSHSRGESFGTPRSDGATRKVPGSNGKGGSTVPSSPICRRSAPGCDCPSRRR